MSTSNPEFQRTFDHVIVGAGTAGCLLANRLSADPHRRVLLLEAGGPDDYLWIHIPVGYLKCIGNPRTDWLYQTEAEAGLSGRRLRYPRGRVLGGSSSINGMIYMRGQSRDYDQWADITADPAWGWEACLGAFKRHEDHWRADAQASPEFLGFHAGGGEWRVDRQRLRWEVLDAFRDAAIQAGVPATDDFNRGTNEGVGYFEVNQRKGWRWNAAQAFLKAAVQRPNIEVWTGAKAQRVLIGRDPQGGLRAQGLEVLREGGGEPIRVGVSRELVLAAGAIGTPALLERSGVGDPAVLAGLQVPVQQALPGVGANLQDHLQIRAVYEVKGTRTLNTLSASWWGKARIGLEYFLRRTGPMSMAPSQLGLFTRSRAELGWPDLEFHVQPLSLPAFGEPLDAFDAITASVCHLNPSSRGTVHARGPHVDDAPLIRPNYLSTEDDQRVAADALRCVRRIAAQPALARFEPRERKPGVQAVSEADLRTAAAALGTTIFHPVGTCRMGRSDDPDAVVDSRLRLRGVAGVRVVDASVMPTITSGNTNAPTLMLAERAAAWMLEPSA